VSRFFALQVGATVQNDHNNKNTTNNTKIYNAHV